MSIAPRNSLLPLAVLTLSFELGLASELRAQGSDDCATPQAIAGTGTFPFDNSAASAGSQGQGYAECFSFGTADFDFDVWFVWTAPEDGNVAVATCGLTSIDSKIAVYAGSGCPSAPPLACSEDACAFQSRLNFAAVAGATYTIQLGSFPSAPGGAGSFLVDYAPPPPGCGTGIGPDVVVGDLNSVFNATASGGIDAIALGGTACNVGTARVDWNGSVGASPALRQNLLRYKVVDGAGRFEQVGMSWLKHGFYAVQDSFCCACQLEPGDDYLGVGCSDAYGASLNATQMYLTPNWEVNAHTGNSPFPTSDPPWSGSVARRLQVAVTDLETTGGGSSTRYFGEGQYVAHDDAQAGNGDNNASWRELSVVGGPFNFDLDLSSTSFTVTGQAAIRAWQAVDPDVQIAEVRVPGEGLLIVGWRATPLGGLTWRYEYAVYNMNSDRGVGSFSLPISLGASVSNAGFHDVSYHSGDGPGDVNWSAADWPAVVSGQTIRWACETQAQNPNANALRWGTLYNFRFDSILPPRPTTATLGLWKSGGPAGVAVQVEGPSEPVTSSCPGDGSSVPCPCGNQGGPGRGCENSGATGGALLTWSGNPSLSADNLLLNSSGERPMSLSIFLQGDQEIFPVVFGDGLRCAGGTLKRLFTRQASGGSVSAPIAGDPSISARSAALGDPIPPYGMRQYQVYYRDAAPSYCPDPPGSTFNATNGLRVVWGI